MTRAAPTTPLGVIHSVAGEAGELALIGALVRLAVEDAERGDPEARAWLAGPSCRHWLGWLAPDGVDPDQLQRALLARLPEPAPWQAALPIAEED